MRENSKKIILVIIIVMILSMIQGCSKKKVIGESQNDITDTLLKPVMGGEITIAFQSAPENFDIDHSSSDWVVTAVLNHVYEGLFELNTNNEAIPQIAESYNIIDKGKTYEIYLRKDVKFQDGDGLEAEDVKASMDRWFKVNPAGVAISEFLINIEIVNKYEILVKFNKAYAPFLNVLASPVACQKMIIKKKEIIDKFGKSIIREHIGTGPYYFDKIIMGEKVVLKKNENYTPVKQESSGLSGKRVAYLDKITIEFIPEENVRIAGLKSGRFDFIDELSIDRYAEIEEFSKIKPIVCNFRPIGAMAFNYSNSPFEDINLIRAVSYAININKTRKSYVNDSKYWSSVDGSWFKEGTVWYNPDAGSINDSEDLKEAKVLVENSNYNGEVITIIGRKSDLFCSSVFFILKNKFKKIGLNVELKLYDRLNYLDYLKSGKWNIVLSKWSDMSPDSQVFEPWLGIDGWIIKLENEEYAENILESDQSKKLENFKEFYIEFWKSVPYIKVFNNKRLYGINDNLKNHENYVQPFFWNAWLEK